MQSDRLDYYRCRLCLTVYTHRGTPEPAFCAGCGGRLEWLGTVAASGVLQKTHLDTACDFRCTGALGPKCDCSCHGENHGTGLLVETVYAEDRIPRLQPRHPEECVARATEFREALSAAEARIDRRFPGIRERRYIPNTTTWRQAREQVEALSRAKRLKVHSLRLKALGAICPQREEVPVVNPTLF